MINIFESKKQGDEARAYREKEKNVSDVSQNQEWLEERKELRGFLGRALPLANNLGTTYSWLVREQVYFKEFKRLARDAGPETRKIVTAIGPEKEKLMAMHVQAYEKVREQLERVLNEMKEGGFGEESSEIRKTIPKTPEIEGFSMGKIQEESIPSQVRKEADVVDIHLGVREDEENGVEPWKKEKAA